jgi:hypothetical protein
MSAHLEHGRDPLCVVCFGQPDDPSGGLVGTADPDDHGEALARQHPAVG